MTATEPSITSVTLDETSYAPGATATLTVVGVFTESAEVTVTLANGSTGSTTLTVSSALTVTDSLGHTWEQKSLTATQAVYTTVV